MNIYMHCHTYNTRPNISTVVALKQERMHIIRTQSLYPIEKTQSSRSIYMENTIEDKTKNKIASDRKQFESDTRHRSSDV